MSLAICLSSQALKDLQKLRKQDSKLFAKAFALIMECTISPYEGLGKPEPLKHQLSGCWSRRVSSKHRIVYQIANDQLQILGCAEHYGDK